MNKLDKYMRKLCQVMLVFNAICALLAILAHLYYPQALIFIASALINGISLEVMDIAEKKVE